MSEDRPGIHSNGTRVLQVAEAPAQLPLGARIPDPGLLLLGDARDSLTRFPDGFFQACITSPPYWGLRDYSLPGQIGAEDTLEDYISTLTGVFREVRRVLDPEGTLWLNIGDGYTSGNRGWRATDRKNAARAMGYRPKTPNGLKPKDLLGIPWRLAFSLQSDGWYLRSDIVWHKPNCQPESVKDRPTRSHEYLFQLVKSDKYRYDASVMVEPSADGLGVRNMRSVWSIPTVPNQLPHSAVFPVQLVEPCLLATTEPGQWVLDPFFGAGTVGVVAKRHHRRWVGIELKREFVELATRRIDGARVTLAGEQIDPRMVSAGAGTWARYADQFLFATGIHT